MSDRIHVFRNFTYDRECGRLLADPIIIGMAEAIYPATQPGVIDFDSWDFVVCASREYHKRGGRLDMSIGGPAEAIKRIVQSQFVEAR